MIFFPVVRDIVYKEYEVLVLYYVYYTRVRCTCTPYNSPYTALCFLLTDFGTLVYSDDSLLFFCSLRYYYANNRASRLVYQEPDRNMASGMGARGTVGRCYGFFADLKQCQVSEI